MQPAIDPLHMAITEPVRGSAIPVRLTYVETADGLYAPIGLRTPPGTGPFPLILFASGNGGGGMAAVREATQNRSWTRSNSSTPATRSPGRAIAPRWTMPTTGSAGWSRTGASTDCS